MPEPRRRAIIHIVSARWVLAALICALLPASSGRADPEGKIVKVEHQPPLDVPTLGPRLAPVTIEYFMDPAEGSSWSYSERLEQLAERHPQRLRVIYRIVSRRRRPSWQSEALREAFAHGRFFPFLDALHDRMRWRNRKDLAAAAEAAGLDPKAMDQAVTPNENPHTEVVENDYWYAMRRRISAFPGFLINGEPKVLSAGTLDELETLYDQAYEPARVRLDDGMRLDDLYPWLLREADASVEYPVGLVAGSVDGITRRDKPPKGMGKLVGGRVDTNGPHTRGAEHPATVLVFYCNFQTRNCKNMHDRIEELRMIFRDELRVVFHHMFDDEDQRQPFARQLAEGGACAHDQGAFWSYYDEMFSSYLSKNFSDEDVMARVEKLELEVEKFRTCFENREHAEAIEDARVAAERAGIAHTPSVVIGGRVYIGVQSTHVLRDLLLVELSPGVLETLLSE